MLKKRCRLFLGLVVLLASSACVTPTHASSAVSVIITHIQSGGASGARAEFIGLYNNSSADAYIGNWCLVNKARIQFACFEQNEGELLVLPAHKSANIASVDYMEAGEGVSGAYTHVYAVTNQSSGSIVGGADTIQLQDDTGRVVDSYTWTSALANGKVLQRMVLLELPKTYAVTGSPADWFVGGSDTLPENETEYIEVPIPEPQDPSDEEGEGPAPPISGEPPAAQLQSPYITELFPNPKGSDVGNEFIELYNPNSIEISLANYALRIGSKLDTIVGFPENALLPPNAYAAFTNTDMRFTLHNTASKVQLFMGAEAIGEAVSYTNPKEGHSWAFFSPTGWSYTSSPTPGFPNQLPPLEPPKSTSAALATQKPCAANQYRNPETGRCRLIASATATAPTPCKAGQERNPATNRCRNIVQTSNPAPCKGGQERNPETGRCRNIKQMTPAGHALDPSAVRDAENGVAWYYWVAIAGIIASILVYGAWEWREELKQFTQTVRYKFAGRSK